MVKNVQKKYCSGSFFHFRCSVFFTSSPSAAAVVDFAAVTFQLRFPHIHILLACVTLKILRLLFSIIGADHIPKKDTHEVRVEESHVTVASKKNSKSVVEFHFFFVRLDPSSFKYSIH